jgi:hypothetical protein
MGSCRSFCTVRCAPGAGVRSTRATALPSGAAVCLSTEDPVYLGAVLALSSGGTVVCTAGSRGAAPSTPPGWSLCRDASVEITEG